MHFAPFLQFLDFDSCVSDPQVVAHLLRSAGLGGVAAGPPRGAAAAPPPHPPRGAPRDLLLHHDRLAELAAGEDTLLEHPRAGHRVRDRLPAAGRRLQVGPEAHVIPLFPPPLFSLALTIKMCSICND